MNYKEIIARVGRATCVAAAVVGASACGNSPAPSAPAPIASTLRADVTDPIGDTVSDPRVPVAPDLTRATATVENGNLTLVVSFAPGTFDRQTTRVVALIDADQSPATGIRLPDGLGADFAVDLFPAAGRSTVSRADEAACLAGQACYVDVGPASLTIQTDGMQVVVPLSAINTSSGRIAFQLHAYVAVTPTASVTFDYLPDNTLAPARVQ